MSVLAAAGFVASALGCGIKPDGALDLALVATSDGGPVAVGATFTSNLAVAAPVQVSRAHLATSGGLASAVVLNSGCANAATGSGGVEAAERTCALVAAGLETSPEHVLVCSTGTIGSRLPIERIVAGIDPLLAGRGATREHAAAAAAAILTTDTRSKEVLVETRGIVVGGMAKGAAMIAPNMATMLAVLTTDAAVTSAQLQAGLEIAVQGSFNEITIDGCISTNDTVIVLSSGTGKSVGGARLTEALAAACGDLAGQMVADAECGTKVVRVRVVGAADDASARRAARMVAESNLVKSSWYGEDPNWGRIVSALGAAGTPFDPDRVSVAYGAVTVCSEGVAAGHDEPALRQVLAARELEITCDLGLGSGAGSVLSADMTPAYVEFNAGRS